MQASRRSRSGQAAPVSSFTPATVIDLQARLLASIGKKQTPEALAMLLEVASRPAKREAKTDLEAMTPTNFGQDELDVRVAAVRALQNFKGDPTAAQLLYRIMMTEKSHVALRAQGARKLDESNRTIV